MRAQSAKTTVRDPYRAGLELGEALAKVQPEIVFLFTTIDYTHGNELLEGLYDALDDPGIPVAGCSGDGFLETHGTSETGAAALALNSDGNIRWQLELIQNIDEDPAKRTREALAGGTDASGEQAALAILFSDFRLDASQMETCLETIPYPVFGGLAADDFQLEKSFIIANRQLLENAMVSVHAFGPLSFDISIGNALTPIGKAGTIDASQGKSLHRIDGIDAAAFVERETGKPVMSTDVAATCLLITDEEDPDIRRLRSIASDSVDGRSSFDLFGGIENGRLVQVCNARAEELIAEVHRIANGTKERGFTPAGGLIVSCVGRKGLLGEQLEESEVQSLTSVFGSELPICGLSSLGEIGPLRKSNGEYTRNLFHNMTYVLLLFGK